MRLVEEHSRLSVAEVVAAVAPVVGRSGSLAPFFVLLDGREIEITRDADGGCCPGHTWWRCPGCGAHRRHLYLPEYICRGCLGLHYAAELRGVSGAYRIARMHRQAGVDPRPFERIAGHPRGRERFHRRVLQIRADEGVLLAQLTELSDAAERWLARPQSAGLKRRATAGG